MRISQTLYGKVANNIDSKNAPASQNEKVFDSLVQCEEKWKEKKD